MIEFIGYFPAASPDKIRDSATMNT